MISFALKTKEVIKLFYLWERILEFNSYDISQHCRKSIHLQCGLGIYDKCIILAFIITHIADKPMKLTITMHIAMETTLTYSNIKERKIFCCLLVVFHNFVMVFTFNYYQKVWSSECDIAVRNEICRLGPANGQFWETLWASWITNTNGTNLYLSISNIWMYRYSPSHDLRFEFIWDYKPP